ncbi:N-acetylmuramate alpha-1-phosphate uridylyltransferase MurU [Brackiella oedipodis]|uniref:N-acetylmuramate alpha-1-phosphate uridylyltransferase MurU n=1 Tax=Brackiella oedipodis TaxID=124225 RepID=UPI00048B0F8A|nr:nucleotidyltransferase family protein [Brackiella oedipodis]
MKAMILAAGRGSRLRPLTDTTPKPLIEVAGKPLIVHHIERLVQASITEIVINLAWLGPQIRDYLQDGAAWGAQIQYSDEKQLGLETAGGIAKALPLLGQAPFLVINADIWCDWSPQQAQQRIADFTANSLLAYLWLVDNPAHHPQGDFVLNADGRLENSSASQTGLTYSGIGIYNHKLFTHIVPNTSSPLAPVLRQAIAQGLVAGEHFQGQWFDIGTPERLQHINQLLQHQH